MQVSQELMERLAQRNTAGDQGQDELVFSLPSVPHGHIVSEACAAFVVRRTEAVMEAVAALVDALVAQKPG